MFSGLIRHVDRTSCGDGSIYDYWNVSMEVMINSGRTGTLQIRAQETPAVILHTLRAHSTASIDYSQRYGTSCRNGLFRLSIGLHVSCLAEGPHDTPCAGLRYWTAGHLRAAGAALVWGLKSEGLSLSCGFGVEPRVLGPSWQAT